MNCYKVGESQITMNSDKVWIVYDKSQYIKRNYDTLCYTMTRYAKVWYILVSYGEFLRILNPPDQSNTPVRPPKNMLP